MVHYPIGVWTVTGPSGAGKSTLIKRLLEKVAGSQVLTNLTTRQKRSDDVDGIYKHVSKKEFTAADLLWVRHNHGNFYGPDKKTVRTALNISCVSFADIDIFGVQLLHEYARSLGKRNFIRSVYLDITDEAEIRSRLVQASRPDIELRIVECRPWRAAATKSFVPFHFIDASLPKEEVFRRALTYFTSST